MIVPNRKRNPASDLPRWHKPKIVDFGIHLSARKNTWRNFFNIIDKQFTSHHTFPTIFPKAEITKTSVLRTRALTRVRLRKLREREREGKRNHDPESFLLVPLRDSVVHKLAAELKTEQGDRPVKDREWDRMIGLAAAKAIEWAVENKPKRVS